MSKADKRNKRRNKTQRRLFSGFRPAVYARQVSMLGIRQPFPGPVFDTLEDAEN
jgi:hypothetical protein